MAIGKIKTALLISYVGAASVSEAMITPARPEIEQFYHLNHGTLEWLISIFMIGYVLGQLIYGPLSNRFGGLRALRAGLLLNIIGVLICILATHIGGYPVLLFGRFLTALGAAAGLACTFILMHELLPANKAKQASAYLVLAFTTSLGLAVTLGGLVSQYFGWQDIFFVMLAHAIGILAATYCLPDVQSQKKSIQISAILNAYRRVLKYRQLSAYAIIVGLCSVASYCYSAAAPLYAISILKLSPAQYAFWNILNMAGMLSSSFLSAQFMRRHLEKKALYLSLYMILACILSLCALNHSTHPNALWFFGTTTLLYLFSGMIFSLASYLSTQGIEDKASGSSMMSFINMSSALLAVIIMGYLPSSILSAFAITLLLFWLLAILMLRIGRPITKFI